MLLSREKLLTQYFQRAPLHCYRFLRIILAAGPPDLLSLNRSLQQWPWHEAAVQYEQY